METQNDMADPILICIIFSRRNERVTFCKNPPKLKVFGGETVAGATGQVPPTSPPVVRYYSVSLAALQVKSSTSDYIFVFWCAVPRKSKFEASGSSPETSDFLSNLHFLKNQ